MLFRLTNAPATFQSLMNFFLKNFQRKCVLNFFDDILIYSSSMDTHLEHLHSVFQLMRLNSLFAKRGKCAFSTDKVEYLRHYIEAKGVYTNPSKIKVVEKWHVSEFFLRFLGLAGYYRRSVQNFGTIARPLIALIKKEAFFGLMKHLNLLTD